MDDMLFPAPSERFVLTHFLVSNDVEAAKNFYTGVLGGTAIMDGAPTVVKIANSWIIINEGGGPTEDKPEVVLDVPADSNKVSAFMNIRVADIQDAYEEWSAKGATLLTPPIDRGSEISLLHARSGRPPDRGRAGDRRPHLDHSTNHHMAKTLIASVASPLPRSSWRDRRPQRKFR